MIWANRTFHAFRILYKEELVKVISSEKPEEEYELSHQRNQIKIYKTVMPSNKWMKHSNCFRSY